MQCVPHLPTPVLIGSRRCRFKDRLSRHAARSPGTIQTGANQRSKDTFAEGYLAALLTGAMLEINHLESGTRECRSESMFSGVKDRLAHDFSVWNEAGNPIISLADVTTSIAGVTILGELASAIGARVEEAAIVAELKAGSEEAYAWLIGEFQRPVYGLVYRMVNDPADAADTTQDVFLKVFRGMKQFHGESSLKTWIYRIALHEASNRRRWWFRHKSKETSIEPTGAFTESGGACAIPHSLVDGSDSPFDRVAHEEVRARVEEELRQVSEPYRTTLILRDLEEMSYEEIG